MNLGHSAKVQAGGWWWGSEEAAGRPGEKGRRHSWAAGGGVWSLGAFQGPSVSSSLALGAAQWSLPHLPGETSAGAITPAAATGRQDPGEQRGPPPRYLRCLLPTRTPQECLQGAFTTGTKHCLQSLTQPP